MFRYQTPFLVNEHGKVLDINGNVDAENRNVEIYQKHGKINQQWDLVYADEWKGEPDTGDMNDDFGLIVNTDFYVVSKLPSGRYLDIIDTRNFAIKTRNGRKSQLWYFHQQSLTIRSRTNNQSWDIKNSGKT
jgi:hypothetical protein